MCIRDRVELFEARFDPCTGKESDAEIKRGMSRFGAQLKSLAADDEAAMNALKSVVEARAKGRNAQVDATRNALLGLMDRVSSLDEDRIPVSYTHLDVYKRQSWRWIIVPMAPSMTRMRSRSAPSSAATRAGCNQGSSFMAFPRAARSPRNAVAGVRG